MTSITAMCIWALATMGLSPLPIRYQILPGAGLLLVLPILLIWLGRDYGALPVVVCIFAAVSMFRKPLIALVLGLKRWITRT
ncbi:DUF2484 family protein [Pacificibacter marinus]|uniref:DUF2484 family protein n=1 Tax=Pacificibacter marinus TaxID=658057 RepID=UPI001C071B5F|nr:DUF2484 family protein [Pacificibacter marinus]